MIEYIILFFIGILYWPLIFIRIRGAYKDFEVTRRKFVISVLFSAVAAYILSNFIIADAYLGSYFPIATAAAIIPIALLLAMPNGVGRRTKAKILVLAVYFHIVWQMIPQINLILAAAETLATLGILFLSSYSRKQKTLLYKTSETSIGDIWK